MSREGLLPVPRAFPSTTSAVVAIARRRGDGAVLYIRRRTNRSDPWSGDVAFPGGWRDPEDGLPEDTARRETLEEVGVELGPAVGALPPVKALVPRRGRFQVLALVFEAEGGPLTLDTSEVAAADWVPWRALGARPRWVLHRLRGVPLPVPAVDLPVGRLWGMTLDLTRELVRRSGSP